MRDQIPDADFLPAGLPQEEPPSLPPRLRLPHTFGWGSVTGRYAEC